LRIRFAIFGYYFRPGWRLVQTVQYNTATIFYQPRGVAKATYTYITSGGLFLLAFVLGDYDSVEFNGS